MTFTLFLLGAEQPAWRSLLGDLGVRNVGLSFWSLHKRLPKKKAYSMEWDFDGVFLDSGGFGANKDPGAHSAGEWKAYGAKYIDFVLEHLDSITMVSEFDCLALGPKYMEEVRRSVWNTIPVEKFLPIWHPEFGLPALDELGERYQRIGVAQEHIAQPGLNITPHLNRLANKGVKLHGLAMSRPDSIRHVRFDSVSSTSWLSAMRYGETIIWDGARLVRYPTKMKDQARLRHRNDFERNGFDVAKIKADDPREVTRVAVWSWLQYEASVRGERGLDRVTPSPAQESDGETETPGTDVAHPVEGARKNGVAPRPREASEMRMLPVFGFTEHEALDPDSGDGEAMTKTRLPMINSTPIRVCDTCFVRTECPAFEPAAACSYEIPIEVRTPMQRRALMNGLVEMQAQRVAFMRFREELSGGYADPNLSLEFDRLLKTFQVQAELEDDREFFRMSVEAKGKAGVLSRLFGREAADLANPLAVPLGRADTERVMGKVIKGETG